MRKGIAIGILSILGGFSGAFLYDYYEDERGQITALNANEAEPMTEFAYPARVAPTELSEDFVKASAVSTASVVYVRNISEQTVSTSFFDLFFGEPGRVNETVSTGSGVIFSRDGYIVTNNHVVEHAKRIEIIHNKKTYDAILVGTDPSSDLAVLKIDAGGLPAIPMGNSRDLQVGEWVLAVGNPFNLTSTVTAGIVSAKGRNINIVRGKFPIESFIQTDAAINPGNSGGALVDKNGDLVGINTAILSRTGSYAGYGFAVPIDIVRKVVRDLIEYGEVQQSFIGAEITDIDERIANNLGIELDDSHYTGVAIVSLQQDGAASKGGLRKGDIIVEMDGALIDGKGMYDEVLSTHSPGDRLVVAFERKGERKVANITLTNREGTTEIIKSEIYSSRTLGADLESVSKVEKDRLEIEHGVRIKNVYRGSDRGLMSDLGIKENFIITHINSYPIKSPDDLSNVLAKIKGRVRIEGVDENGVKGYYSFYFR